MVRELNAEQQARRQSMLGAIERRINPVKTPLQYKLALLLSAVIMVLLPVIYVAIACAFAFVVYYHAVNSIGIFNHVRGKGVIMAAIIYVGPLIAGVTAVLFMFKPLFSRAPKSDLPTSLSRDDEPILFQFVDKLCDTVHAPRPKRIDVDCQVNASASFHRGWFSMLLGNDLVLTIGLPLITGMYEQARSELGDDENLSIDGVKSLRGQQTCKVFSAGHGLTVDDAGRRQRLSGLKPPICCGASDWFAGLQDALDILRRLDAAGRSPGRVDGACVLLRQ